MRDVHLSRYTKTSAHVDSGTFWAYKSCSVSLIGYVRNRYTEINYPFFVPTHQLMQVLEVTSPVDSIARVVHASGDRVVACIGSNLAICIIPFQNLVR
jgi:hypothetical protein